MVDGSRMRHYEGMGGIEIRAVETDADYEAWRQVRIAVLPHERCPSVAELRELATPHRLLLLAERDGTVVANGLSDRSNEAGRGFVAPRVRPEARRQGVGTQMLSALADHAVAQGYAVVGAGVEDEGSLAFGQRFGFVETGRQVEQVRPIGHESWPDPPTAYAIVTVAERPELWATAYEQVAQPTLPDMDTPTPVVVSAEEWATEWINDPAAILVAASGAVDETLAGFRGLPNRLGRARMFAEKSVGLDDPGMVAFRRILDGLAKR